MYTKTDAEAYVLASLTSDAIDDPRAEYDIDGIIDTIYDENGGTYDLAPFDTDRYWQIIEAHAKEPQA